MTTPTCTICNESKAESEFRRDKRKTNGLSSWCKTCTREYNRKWKRDHYDTVRNTDLKYDYGITLETFNSMLATQGGRCAGCEESFQNSKSTHVDHCHATGKVRGLLCHNCNRAIGMVKDDPATLNRLASYLRNHGKQ